NTGTMNMQNPATGHFVSVTGQTGQIDLTVSGMSGNLTYAIGSGSPTTVSGMNCANQTPPAIDDGSSAAPLGVAKFPSLFSLYATRPPWKVAGVDYAVGFPSGISLSDPTTSTIPGTVIDAADHLLLVTGNGVTISGYDFSLHGGWGVGVPSG